MTDPTPQTLFAEYLARRSSAASPDFEEWVASYSAHESELRALHARARLADNGRDAGLSFFKGGEHQSVRSAPGLEAGKVIGDFRLISLIGEGGMGQVWEAEQVSLRRTVALKFIRPDRLSEKQHSYFEREARAGGRLSHPGIVAVHGFGESDGIAWIAMELVEGCWTLRDFLDDAMKSERLPDTYDESVARFIARLAEALEAAHRSGVIHRDLKPQNILITSEELPKITDFGLARITDELGLSQTGDLAGTYYYMSPEQVAAKRMGIDHRTDIFSLGVVFYEMLTLRRPFEGDTTQQVAHKIVVTDPTDVRAIRSRVPRDLVVICGKSLEKDPDRRYATAAELALDLKRHLNNEPIQARPPTVLDRSMKWGRRNPTRCVAAILVVVAFMIISALAIRIANQRDDLQVQRRELTRSKTRLQQNADTLATLEAEASARAEDLLSLSDAKDYEHLLAEAADLFPVHPGLVHALEDWIQRAETLRAQLPEHQGKRDELWATRAPGLDPDAAWADPRIGWWHGQLSELIDDLKSMKSPGVGLLTEDGVSTEHGWSVPRRLALARRLARGFAAGGEFATRWRAALSAVGEVYPDLNLTPQMGLVPIGADQDSGLWEFWHVQTGAEPVRDREGRLSIRDDTGLVFVLLPAATYWMGAQSEDPNGRNFDPGAWTDEGPVREVRVENCFMAKTEMTQGQWKRMTGVDPSLWTRATDDTWIEGAHPVEQVSWTDCMELLANLDLTLPTEAQWEYGCRAGSTQPRPFAFEDFAEYANVGDISSTRSFQMAAHEDWDDGAGTHSPVAYYLPNAFGLYDCLGNLIEWCRDGWGPYPTDENPVASQALNVGATSRPYRGASFYALEPAARSSNRAHAAPSTAANNLGLRPVRAVRQ
ncbi:MAG: serine/threonine protein kinase/formylglycine-generating enzyme required for sulfatase activity [Chlamydiales bacterium]|jgi:serine/threonine protein kinase/formylglycine-generating enzyme required for sulfatase activity